MRLVAQFAMSKFYFDTRVKTTHYYEYLVYHVKFDNQLMPIMLFACSTSRAIIVLPAAASKSIFVSDMRQLRNMSIEQYLQIHDLSIFSISSWIFPMSHRLHMLLVWTYRFQNLLWCNERLEKIFANFFPLSLPS